MKRFVYLLFGLICLLAISGCQNAPTSGGKETPSVISPKITGSFEGCGIGVFLADGHPTTAEIDAYESVISRETAVVMWFLDFNSAFPDITCEMAADHSAIPMITWMPENWNDPSDDTASLESIISGNCDIYINTFANAVKNWGKPIFIRFAHEMNGNWYDWSGANHGNSGVEYIAAWRRIHATFDADGATNVTWVWCPMNFSLPTDSWNNAANYYPGDQYVDWVGFDGYSRPSNSWQTFDQISNAIYSSLGAYNKPIMIGEMSSATAETHDKSAWITDTFNKLKSSNYNDIKLYIWFNLAKTESDGFCDWRIDSSNANKVSFEAAMAASYYLSTIH